jgi:hypothetical protein
MVDAEDYTFWAQNFGSTGESGSTSAIVPEPSTVLFAVMAIAGLATGLDRRWFHA